MPVLRRWKREMILEEPEEFMGAEMYPFLSNQEEEQQEVQIQAEPAPAESFIDAPQENQRFWTRIRTLFQHETW